ncbi:type II and III secretion system protein family protein [Henriciella pelagia]|jgi:pilus assembly protein CpaC|uniref:Secretin n=1 Tax=Henriciella pelagia TaxID=1977912 RepID=A0ABQ1IYV5_9PROT|nr:type II and III secretion system protein family protein [Henriciella pelagia]GGB55806.1 secretin [Henriciella pelagia]
MVSTSRKRNTLLACLAAICLTPAASGTPPLRGGEIPRVESSASGPLQTDLTVVINRSTPITVARPFKRIAVSQPEIADASPTADNRLYVRGRTIGATNILVYDDEGELVEIIDVRVQHDLGAIRSDVAALFPDVRLDLRTIANRLHVRGGVPDDATAAEILAIASSYAPDGVIDALKITSPQQVMLEVRFVEASREDVNEIGLGSDIYQAGDFVFSTGASILSGSTPKTLGAIFGNAGDVNIDVFLSALEQKGIIRTLAEPNLVARSGETASFLAGGEFPVPVASDKNVITIEFREFGVSLDFTPTILSDSLMSLEVSPEVSQLDPRNSIRLEGVEIPALSVRRANTIVELSDGESFAIAGLIQNTVDSTTVQTPWIGDVPILGALFRSNRFRENETELVIIITPRLVRPASAGTRLVDPLTSRREPSEAERVLMGKLDDDAAPASGSAVNSNIDAQLVRRDLGYVPQTGTR